MANWCYKINDPKSEHNGVTLWSGRYCAVAGIIFFTVNEDVYVLANKRGSGTPDFQGYWNCPCGFLDEDESGEVGCARETFEETGFKIDPNEFWVASVETDPKLCNKGHVTIRYVASLHGDSLPKLGYKNINGEENEVADVRWVHINEVPKLKWAFNHADAIASAYVYWIED